MAVKYMDKVIDGVLKILNDPELTSLDFLQTVGEIFCDDDLGMNIVDFENFGLEQNYGLAITKLELENCCNIIPKLNNRNIKELILNNCNVQNIDQLQLDGLVKLCLQQGQGSKCNSKLIYNMTKFNMLTQLSLNGYNDVDISPLSQMIQLNVLSLKLFQIGSQFLFLKINRSSQTTCKFTRFSTLRQLNCVHFTSRIVESVTHTKC
ncbi:Hypothetical_protein [Hexamita inflata]|uniref:Hypothetical_protein n=1 Tax=Hexamita inflata TaxID=28002 RepID=A0AA86R621_9EUKA|nr:Hypothetical protein HINF_LOCUS54219 [Hexamita inflata]